MTPSPVRVYTHPDCLRHDPGPDQPETPTRLATILARLETDPAADIQLVEPATTEPLLVVHPKEHLERLRALSESGGAVLAWDTFLDPASWDAVLGATGCVLGAVDHAHQELGHAFCAIRPPGHHALASIAMGFCLVNNVVVAARRAQALGRERVLIIDWDVHHIPRPPDLPAERYVGDLWDTIERATDGWEPHMVLISAGFDTMEGDPLGGFTLTAPDYADLTRRLRDRLPMVPIVSLLEGGYNPPVMAEGVAAHIAALG
jgi:acetoin utilization deacetylase AcuC-like enzyme